MANQDESIYVPYCEEDNSLDKISVMQSVRGMPHLLFCSVRLVVRFDHTRFPPRHWLAHISAGTDFCTYVEGDYFAYSSECYTPSKPIALF
jgi:hypothetical protein